MRILNFWNMNEEPIENGELTPKKSPKDNLMPPWQPGESGNLKGRPIGRFSLTNRMIKRLEENPEETEAILDWLIANRKDLVWNKIDPNPPTDLNIGGQQENPIRVIVIEKPEDNEAISPAV